MIKFVLVFLRYKLGYEPDTAGTKWLAVFIVTEDLNIFLSWNKKIINF